MTGALSAHIPADHLAQVRGSGEDLLQRIGEDELRKIVAGVACGENVRTATEPLTRRRLAALNAAILITLLRASRQMSPHEMLRHAQEECKGLKQTDPRRTVLMWILGLTKKQVENVLRSDDSAWSEFVDATARVAARGAQDSIASFGELRLRVEVGDTSDQWDWLWAHTLMAAAGAQTLGTRGSEKSMYGKFFEKLVIGSVLEILGFRLDRERSGRDMTYWLSERQERRESDATAVVGAGQGIRFDIGFIGPGNPEITLDKVSRFERTAEIRGRPFRLSTVIIVDRVARGSSIIAQAELIEGRIVQMSSSLWVQDLDQVIGQRCRSYGRTFQDKPSVAEIRRLVVERMRKTDLQALLSVARSQR